MASVRVPKVTNKKFKRYRIVTKPTTDAFCRGKRTAAKIASEEWLEVALLKEKLDPDVEQYFYEEI